MSVIAKKIKVSIDGLTDFDSNDKLIPIVVEAYELDPNGWNGWACPGFTLEVAQEILKAMCYDFHTYTYDSARDTFIFTYDQTDTEEYTGEAIVTEDGVKHLYPIGAWQWVWSLENE